MVTLGSIVVLFLIKYMFIPYGDIVIKCTSVVNNVTNLAFL